MNHALWKWIVRPSGADRVQHPSGDEPYHLQRKPRGLCADAGYGQLLQDKNLRLIRLDTLHSKLTFTSG